MAGAGQASVDERAVTLVPKALLDGVVEQFRPVRVILFGSRARGDARPDSDIDLLVVVDDDLPRERRDWQAANEARRDYRGAADILPWRRSAYEAERGVVGSLPWTVDHEGVTVYGPEVQPLSGDPAGMRVEVARRWLATADEEMRTAEACLRMEPSSVNNAAYHCQQCAEKLIKGCLILAEVPFPKTHKLGELIDLLPDGFPAEIVAAMTRVQGLASWAVAGRYPADPDRKDPKPPTPAAVEAALRDLAALRALVAQAIYAA